MDNIEMTDVDGDALTLITREDGTWITCTSGRDEVTVGPFATRLVRTVLSRSLGEPGETVATLLGRTAHAAPSSKGSAATGDTSWGTATGDAVTGQTELAAELRGLDLTLDDPDALAAQLMTLGYRKP